jgi:hypothetical protein
MNITNLILQLQSIQSDSTLDQQAISKAIKLPQVGAVESVGQFSDLPPAAGNNGKLFYVFYDGVYVSVGSNWVPIAQ